MSGTEVEGIDWVGAPRDPENLSRFVVGKVLTRDKHPNADKLSLCTVEVGEANGGVKQIVCGADNFQAGDTVAVSLTGATLESGLKLKKANLRGVESDGMMMSEQELGYEEKSPGIVVLPDEWIVGAPLQDYLPVSEAVLELELTSNRPDCFSVYGIAREVAAAARLELAPPPTAGPAVLGGAPADEAIAVEVADPDLCPRYAAQVIRGVTVGDSPAWLKARLTHAGMRPISNVVDVTNYVMLGWGQPLHAFDAGKIRGDRLIARRAKAGEKIVTLDGVRARARRPDAGHRRRRAAAGHRRRVRQRRRRGGRAGPPTSCSKRPTSAARASCAPSCTPASAARPATASRRGSTRTSCPEGSPSRRGSSPSSAAAPSRRARSTCAARRPRGRGSGTGRRRPTVCSDTPFRRRSRPASCAASSARWTRAAPSAPRPPPQRRPQSGRSRRRRSAPISRARSTSSRRSGASPATIWRRRRFRGIARPAA